MQGFRWTTRIALVVAAALLAACGSSADPGATSTPNTAAIGALRILVPNAPGSGYDTTARSVAKTLQQEKLAATIDVLNIPGAGGTIGLQRLADERGHEDIIMQMGLGVVGAVYASRSPVTLAQTIPLARLIEEPAAIVVKSDSPYATLPELIAAWKARPEKILVGGGSAPGGPDHLAPMLLAKAVGISPKRVNYTSFDGGGELLTALLEKKVVLGATGIGEVIEQAKEGQVRILAVTSPERIPGTNAPTLLESGIGFEFTNWRGLVAPADLPPARRDGLIALLQHMHDSPTWRQVLAEEGWIDAFSTGDTFGAFLDSENDRVSNLLKELGLNE